MRCEEHLALACLTPIEELRSPALIFVPQRESYSMNHEQAVSPWVPVGLQRCALRCLLIAAKGYGLFQEEPQCPGDAVLHARYSLRLYV